MSTPSPDDAPRAAHPWWFRVCRVGWKVIRFFWVTFLLAFVLPKVVEVLFSDKPLRSLPNLWPLLEGIISHPVWTLLVFLGLLLLTGLFWFGSQERNATTQRALSEHDRVHMLRRLRLRYEQMLSQSLQGAVQMELGLVSSPAAIQNAASLALHLPNQPEQPHPPHTSIREAYELAQQELLILGEPGTGKSTLLLELAHHLVEKAEQDAEQPLPVLLPLSSWAMAHPPLQEWLSEQVARLYDVPRSLSQQWVQAERLLPLLDGLDEMEVSKRPDCIAAINTYHHGHLQPLVVCSRTNEYETAATHERLVLHTAVVVQPLSPQQVDTHLANMGRPLAALRTALRKNDVLRELATTPLMLQILILTYHGTLVRELSQKEVQLREQIWDDYVQRMVVYKGDEVHYPLDRTKAWLGWLARQMRQHSQTIFNLEQLQPDWLPKGRRVIYRWSVGLVVGLLFGLVWGLVVGLGYGLIYELVNGLLFGLGRGLVVGLLFGLGRGLGSGLGTKIEPAEALTWSWKSLRSKLLGGLLGGLLVGLLGGLLGGLLVGLVFGPFFGHTDELDGGLIFGLGVGLGVGLGMKIEPAEVLTWSWKSLRSKLLVGLLVGLIFGLFSGLFYGLFYGLGGGLFYGLFYGLLWGLLGWLGSGLSRKQLTERLRLSPNEGIRRSLKYGLLVWLFFGLFFGLLYVLVNGLLFGLLYGLLGGLVVGLLFGLGAAMQHYTLRFWLWQSHSFPWKAQTFLDKATTCILLRHIGGGYSFVHRLLLDYFADLNTGPAPASTTPPSAPGHSPSPTTPSA